MEGLGITDRFELTAGGFGFTYQDNQARPLDLLIQPKYVLHSSLGAIPSLSVAAATLFPLSGNRQHWDGYALAHVSWFLFTPDAETDPYDNNLAIHLNLGAKTRYDAGPTTFQSKLYWAAGLEVITPVTREVRFLGEIYNGDPFAYEEKFPAFQTGFRWYKNPMVQIDWSFGAYGTVRWKHKLRRVRSLLLAGTIRFRQVCACYSTSSDNHAEFRK